MLCRWVRPPPRQLRRRARGLTAPATPANLPPFAIHGALTELVRGAIPAVGVEAHVTHTFGLADTTRFAELSGDDNPIHTNAAFARTSDAGVDRPIVQGMLSASLFATIFGRTIPGAVYVQQGLRWRAPLLVDEEICARIRVVRVRKRFVDCETVCVKTADGTVVVEGQATVLLPPPPSSASPNPAHVGQT